MDKDDSDAIPVHHIMSEVSAMESHLERVRVAMHADPVFSKIKHQIFHGWPDARRSISKSIFPFWNYIDELVVEGRLIFKVHKLVIHTSKKHKFLKDLHICHLGEKKTLLQARQCAYWPGITGDIKNTSRDATYIRQ